MKRGHLRRAAKLLVLLQLVVGLAPSGFSLCVAADGHTALELSHAELPCLRHIARHHPGEKVLDANEFARHPCEDVPLLETGPYRATDNIRLTPPTVPVALAPFLTVPASPRPLLHLVTSAYPPRERAPRALRSVILLV